MKLPQVEIRDYVPDGELWVASPGTLTVLDEIVTLCNFGYIPPAIIEAMANGVAFQIVKVVNLVATKKERA